MCIKAQSKKENRTLSFIWIVKFQLPDAGLRKKIEQTKEVVLEAVKRIKSKGKSGFSEMDRSEYQEGIWI